MAVVLLCPNLKCRAVVQVSDKARGKKVRCGQCGMAFVVPARGDKPKKPTPAKTAAPPK